MQIFTPPGEIDFLFIVLYMGFRLIMGIASFREILEILDKHEMWIYIIMLEGSLNLL